MPKRVYEIAKERGMQSQQVLRRLRLAGIEVKATSSVVSDADIEKVFGKTGQGSITSSWFASQGAPKTVRKEDIEKEQTDRAKDLQDRKDARAKQTEQIKRIAEAKRARDRKQREDAIAAAKQAQEVAEQELVEPVVSEPVVVEPVAESVQEEIQKTPAPETPKTEAELRRHAQELAQKRVSEQAAKRRAEADRQKLEDEERARAKAKAEADKPKKIVGSRDSSYQPNLDRGRAPRPGQRRVIIDQRAGQRRNNNKPERREQKPAAVVVPKNVELELGVTVQEAANALDVSASTLIKALMSAGDFVTITQSLTEEQLDILSLALDREITIREIEPEIPIFVDSEDDLKARAPIVTIMGHVDHGKTTLLDAIRQTSVAAGESGGITQHIGAYQASLPDGRTVTFIDTPGHEAFTSLRARGAKVTDIAVLVVAADDGVRPQTEEAINHAKAAGVPIVVAINKIDKENANIEKVKTELAEKFELIPEEWGGDTIMVPVSAKQQTNLEQLVELLALQADILELRSNPDTTASGYILESHLDAGRGPVATYLVARGTLAVGDMVLAGDTYGRVRALYDYRGNRVKHAIPSMPVEVVGLASVAEAGEFAQVVTSEKEARNRAHIKEQAKKRALLARRSTRVNLENFFTTTPADVKTLNLVIKVDVEGSIAAIEQEIGKISHEEVGVKIIHTGVGQITKTDIDLAVASEAVVIGFAVTANAEAREIAEREGVEIKTYRIIYQLREEIELALTGMLVPESYEESLGTATVRQVFSSSRAQGAIAGCMVTNGQIERSGLARLSRDGKIVYEGKIASLQREKETASIVKSGFECGIVLENFADVKENDVIECYAIRERARSL